MSAPGWLLSHYLHFTQCEPAVTWQSKQALIWIWCYAYGVTTLFLCCRSGALASAYRDCCNDLWGNLTLKRMQMRRRINIQRRSLVDLSRCKAISIEVINIQRERAGTQHNAVSKTTTESQGEGETEGKQKHFNGGAIIISKGLCLGAFPLLLTLSLMVTLSSADRHVITIVGWQVIHWMQESTACS